MVSAPHIIPSIGRIMGIQRSTVETVTRRLGEAGRIPRGSRGRAAPEFGARDMAQVLIGLMSVADGYEGIVTRVVGAVDHIGSLNCLSRAAGDTVEELENALVVIPGGSFLDQLTYMLDECRDDRIAARFTDFVSAIGLTFHREGKYAWLEVTGRGESIDSNALQSTGYGQRAIFGVCPDAKAAGMIREVRLSIDSLILLAGAIAGNLSTIDDLGNDVPSAAHQSLTDRSGRKGGR